MSRKPRVQRTPEEKWQIVLEGLKSGNVAETCRKYEIAPNLYYRFSCSTSGCATALLPPSAALLRASDPATLTDIQRAARYLYLLKESFASLVVRPSYHW